jgi:hypothetical protein
VLLAAGGGAGAAGGNSWLGELLTDPDHPVQPTKYWVAGDDAYKGNASQSYSILTPWPSEPQGIGVWKDAFNAFQSSCRIEIEGAFGALVKRWAVLQRPLNVSDDHATLLLETLLLLHNECTNARIKDACGRAMSDGYGAGRSSRADYRGPRENWPEIGLADTWFDGAVPLARDGGTNQPLRTALTATLQTHNQPRPPRAPYRGYLTGSAAS